MTAWDWQAHAQCRGLPLVLFFGTEDERYDQTGKRLREERAREVCDSCPVIRDCHEAAEARREFGIWAGLDEDERARERRNASRRVRETAARRAERVA